MRAFLYYFLLFSSCLLTCYCDRPFIDDEQRTDIRVVPQPDTLAIAIDASRRGAPLAPLLGLVHATDPDQIRRAGIQAVRTDQLFDIQIEIARDERGDLVCDWTRLDRTLAVIKQTGVEPLFGIDFTPAALSPAPHLENSARRRLPPVDDDRWYDLVRRTVAHVNETLGRAGLMWEVWNEPELGMFWEVRAKAITRWAVFARDSELWTPGEARTAAAGELRDIARLAAYRRLYRVTVRAVRAADPAARVGGPGTSTFYPRWIKGLINAVAEQNIPLDFVSWHYPAWHDEVAGAVAQANRWAGRLPSSTPGIMITEWNDRIYDRPPSVHRAADALSFLKAYADAGVARSFYYPTPGFYTAEADSLSPVLHAFRLYRQLDGDRVFVSTGPDVHGLAAVDDRNRLSVLFWTTQPDTTRLRIDFTGIDETPAQYVMSLMVDDGEGAYRTVTFHGAFDRNNGSPPRIEAPVAGPVVGMVKLLPQG